MSDDRIYDVGYRRLEDRGRPRPPAWPIARTMLLLAWRKRATKFALLACGGVFLVCAVAIVGQLVAQRFATDLGADTLQQMIGKTQEVFAAFVSVQFYFTTFAIAVVAGGAVADDRAAGAFDLYFSRPLTRGDYALGKLWGAATVPLVTLVLPVLLMSLVATGIAPPSLRAGLWWLVVPAGASALLAAAVLSTTIVGLSAMGTSSRGVGVAYVAILAGVGLVCEGLAAAGIDWAGYLSPSRDLRTVSDALLAIGPKSMVAQLVMGGSHTLNDSAIVSTLALLGYTGLGYGALWHRLRSEVAG